jgi:polysaccharide biosynthesis protein PslH
MNILFLAHRLPYPPNKGDKIRSFNELAHLAQKHNIWCAAFVDDAHDRKHVSILHRICREVAAIRLRPPQALARGLVGLLSGGTLTEAYYRSSRMHRILDAWSRRVRFDAVLAFSSSMAQYALAVPAPRRVIDFCDLDSDKWLQYARSSPAPYRWLYAVEARRLAQKEVEWTNRFDRAVLITRQEAEPLIQRTDPEKIVIVGNGVALELADRDLTPPAQPVVGFVGAMDYKPNVDAVQWFCHDIWPVVRKQVPHAIFRIVGRLPTRHVRMLADLPGVEVTGTVREVQRYVDGFRVSVAPLRIGRGLQNKVLEAMSAARPVVLTSLAACGIAANDGEHYLVADTPEDFAARVVLLLNDGGKAHRIGRAAHRFVADHYHWPAEMGKLEAVLTNHTAVNGRSNGPRLDPSEVFV